MRVPQFRLGVDEDMRWMDEAECRERDTRHWFPHHGNDAFSGQALMVCHRCPVKAPCLEFALRHDEPGIWGATTSTDREFIRQSRRRRSA